MNSKNYLVWGMIAVVAVGALYFLMQGYSKPSTEMQTANPAVVEAIPTQATNQATTSGEVMATATVDYTDSGFTPKSIIVKVGDTVTWVNKSGNSMWVASAVHPIHQVYPEFDQKESVEKDRTYSFTFTKVGNWKYHNHKGPSDTGTVVVE